MTSAVLTSLLLPHLSSSLSDSLPSLNLLCHWKTDPRLMQDGRKAVWSIPYVSVAFFEIHQLWQSGFSRVYSNCCCSCLFEPEIIKKVGQSSHKMYSNNIQNLQESTTILNVCIKKSVYLLNAPRIQSKFVRNFFFYCFAQSAGAVEYTDCFSAKG